MLSAKLTGLKSLASVSLDGFFLFNTCHASDEGDRPRKFPASLSVNHPLCNDRFRSTRATKLWNVSLGSTNVSGAAKWQKKDESVQTDPELLPLTLRATEDRLSECAHALNLSQCLKSTTAFGFRETPPPPIWTVLGLMDYSPALFNLGVWYERQAKAHSSSSCCKYLDKAEEAYRRALQVDVHPLASYNLACLLLSTKRNHAKAGTQTYSVDDLMRIAACHGVREACNYLRQKTPCRPSSEHQ